MQLQIEDIQDLLDAILESLQYSQTGFENIKKQCNGVSDPEKLLERIREQICDVTTDINDFKAGCEKLEKLPPSFHKAIKEKIQDRREKAIRRLNQKGY